MADPGAADRHRGVSLVEVGPRDGLQTEAPVPTAVKLEMIRGLLEAGVRRVEVTSFVNPMIVPQMADAEELVAGLGDPPEGVTYSALILNRRGHERACDSGVRNVAFVCAATEEFQGRNAGKAIRESLSEFQAVAESATRDAIGLRGVVAVAFGCPYEGPVQFDQVLPISLRMADGGADEICLADTIGIANPRQVASWFERTREALDRRGYRQVALATHFHDTRGLALANALAAFDVGVEVFDSSLGGLGRCPFAPAAAGNVASEDLAYLFESISVQTGISIERLLRLGDELSGHFDHPLTSRQRTVRGALSAAETT
jgi:hydroxymethylglutaryl-CoA lyase